MIHRVALQSSSLRRHEPPHTPALVHSASLVQRSNLYKYKILDLGGSRAETR